MNQEIAQLNVRIPKEIIKALRTASAMLEVPVQQLGEDAFAFYYGTADVEAHERRDRVIEAVKKAYPDLITQEPEPEPNGKKGKPVRVKEQRHQLRQSPISVATVCEGDSSATQKALKSREVFVDESRHALRTLPGVLSFSGGQESPLSMLPVAA